MVSCSDDNMDSVIQTVESDTTAIGGIEKPVDPVTEPDTTTEKEAEPTYALLASCENSNTENLLDSLIGNLYVNMDHEQGGKIYTRSLEFTADRLIIKQYEADFCDGEVTERTTPEEIEYYFEGTSLMVNWGDGQFSNWGVLSCLNRSVLTMEGLSDKALLYHNSADLAKAGKTICDVKKHP